MSSHQFDVSLGIQHEVLRLQVSVEDPLTMEVIESLCDAADAEFGSGLIKTPPKDKKAKFELLAGSDLIRRQRGRRAPEPDFLLQDRKHQSSLIRREPHSNAAAPQASNTLW